MGEKEVQKRDYKNEVFTEDQHPKMRKERCLEEMQEIMDLIGPNSVNKSYFARKYHFNRRTIDKWYVSLIMSVPKEQIDLIATKAEQSIQKAIKHCEEVISASSNTRDRIMAIGVLNQTVKTQVELLEAYGRKAKVEERLNVSGNLPAVFNLVEKSVEEIKSERNDNKPKAEGNPKSS